MHWQGMPGIHFSSPRARCIRPSRIATVQPLHACWLRWFEVMENLLRRLSADAHSRQSIAAADLASPHSLRARLTSQKNALHGHGELHLSTPGTMSTARSIWVRLSIITPIVPHTGDFFLYVSRVLVWTLRLSRWWSPGCSPRMLSHCGSLQTTCAMRARHGVIRKPLPERMRLASPYLARAKLSRPALCVPANR